MDALEQEIRDALRTRAGDVEPTPALYVEVRDRIARRRRQRMVGWALGTAAAVLAAVVVVPNLLSDGDRDLDIAQLPDGTIAPGGYSVGLPSAALVGTADGDLVLRDVTTGEDLTPGLLGNGEGRRVTQVWATPGSTPDVFRAAAVRTGPDGAEVVLLDRRGSADGDGRITQMSANQLEAGENPQIALSPDGRHLAWATRDSGAAAFGGAAGNGAEVFVAPIGDDLTVDLDAATPVLNTVFLEAQFDGVDVPISILDWVAGEPDTPSWLWLRIQNADGTWALRPLFVPEPSVWEMSRTPLGSAREVSSDFATPGSSEGIWAIGDGEDGAGAVTYSAFNLSDDGNESRYVAIGSIEYGSLDGAPPFDTATIHARGRRALLTGGESGTGVLLTREPIVEGEGEVAFAPPQVVNDVTAGALLGGYAPDAVPVETPEPTESPEPTEAPGEPGEPGTEEGLLGGGLVVADDHTVTLLHPDGTTQELVTFPSEGHSTVLDVAVRPGSTATDLTLAITTMAEGMYDVRWLRVVDGQVDTTIDPVGTSFPAPPIEGGGFPLATPAFPGSPIPSAVWSPDGGHLAVVTQPGEGQPLDLHVRGWTDDGPDGDEFGRRTASFVLDTTDPYRAAQWVAVSQGSDGAFEGQLVLVDVLGRRAATLDLEVQADGGPAVPDSTVRPDRATGVLDLVMTGPFGPTRIDAVLRLTDDGPVVSHVLGPVTGDDPGAVEYADVDLSALVGPRDVPVLAVWRSGLLVALDPAEPRLVDRATGELLPVPIDTEVVAADAIR